MLILTDKSEISWFVGREVDSQFDEDIASHNVVCSIPYQQNLQFSAGQVPEPRSTCRAFLMSRCLLFTKKTFKLLLKKKERLILGQGSTNETQLACKSGKEPSN